MNGTDVVNGLLRRRAWPLCHTTCHSCATAGAVERTVILRVESKLQILVAGVRTVSDY